MRALLAIATVLCSTVGCAGVPHIEPCSAPPAEETGRACASAFPQGDWEAVHRIEATLPTGSRSVVIGVTTYQQALDRMECVLLSPEGFVLFAGSRTGERSVIERAMPPFDAPDFARALFADVQFLLVRPRGVPAELGCSVERETLCRWSRGDVTTDVVVDGGVPSALRQYVGSSLAREARFRGPFLGGLPAQVELVVFGGLGYRLLLTRIPH